MKEIKWFWNLDPVIRFEYWVNLSKIESTSPTNLSEDEIKFIYNRYNLESNDLVN